MNRRTFLLASPLLLSATAQLLNCGKSRRTGQTIEGSFVGASFDIGHRLFEEGIPLPSEERKVALVIVGGGVAGLSAGWKLLKAGVSDFELLELEPEVGGVSRFGKNSITPYPWGAHYLPLPTKESRAVRELLEELGVIEGYEPGGEPIYQERYLCFSPHERLFIHGRWQDGLLPLLGATARDLDQYQRFDDLVGRYRHHRGRNGRKAFAIPMAYSDRDKELLRLDRISMANFLQQEGLDSRPLHWYVDYCCRDDYGASHAHVSAWAGMHYFASRDAASGDSTVLTWPEGNGWIIQRLETLLAPRLKVSSLVYHLEERKTGVDVHVFLPRENRSLRIKAEKVIYAAPRRFAHYVVPGLRDRKGNLEGFQYAPWLVANLSLRSFPHEGKGAPLAWDNVIYESPSLGYVVANHQSLRTKLFKTVLTYYHALTGASTQQERSRLLKTDWHGWVNFILDDLARPHPDIRELVTRIDIMRWGHAMIQPQVGFIWGEDRQAAAQPYGNIHFAHSDLSGFSIFEEAQYHGIKAAEQVLRQLRVPFRSSL